MSQVSEENLWMIEDNFEKSFAQILTRDSLTAFASRDNLQFDSPCVEVAFNVGNVTEKYRHAFHDLTRKPAYAGWIGSELEFVVKTNRAADSSNPQHKIMLAKVRKNCQMYKLLETWPQTQGAQCNAIADIREKGTKYSVDSDNNLDITIMSFWVMHNLINEAWPDDI